MGYSDPLDVVIFRLDGESISERPHALGSIFPISVCQCFRIDGFGQ